MTTDDVKRKVVRLNVGGTRYDVSRDTLERCEGSMLAIFISDHWKEGNANEKEPIFIDRNGRLFEYVLDYLRTNKVYLPSAVSRAAEQEEFKFYGIDADMSKVMKECGILQGISMKEKADAMNLEVRAIRLSALAECAFWKSSSSQSSSVFQIPFDDYLALQGNFDELRQRLLDRGLECLKVENAKWEPSMTLKITDS